MMAIVEHGESVSVRSTPGTETVFEILLPSANIS
jgi:signal transduction histidine kinase